MKKALIFGIGLLLFSLYFACSLNIGAGNNDKSNAAIINQSRAFGERITVSGTQFFAGGSRIWINGANTPWNNWDDMGGTYNSNWWDTELQTLHDNGINASRLWLLCSGDVGLNIDSSGYVSNATQTFWDHLDSLMQLHQNRQVYLDATLISFDCVKNNKASNWKNMFNSDANIDSFVNNFLIPLVKRYNNNPWLWTIDLCNEPDWLFEQYGIPWSRLQTYFAKCAVAIHANSSILVHVGMAIIKYNSTTCGGAQGNMVSDSSLQALAGGDSRAKVDFWNVHYYPWMDPYWPIPFNVTPVAFGLDASKPSIVGESPAMDSTNHTIIGDYENAYQNGWQGVMPWTANGVDGNGSLATMGPATRAFRDNHYSLVFPGGTSSTASSAPASSRSSVASSTPVSSTASSVTVSSSRSSAASSASSSAISSANNSSAAYQNISLPFKFDGLGDNYYQTAGTITSMNSWNVDILDVNGISFKNAYVDGGSLPAKQNGYYYIHYKGSVGWAHIEIAGTSGASSSTASSIAASSSRSSVASSVVSSVALSSSRSSVVSSVTSSVAVSSSRSSVASSIPSSIASSVAVSSSRSSAASSIASSVASSAVSSTASSVSGSGYAVNYTIANDWGAGGTVNVTIKNNTATAVNGWILSWTFPGNQNIGQIWSAAVTQIGAAVSVTNLSYNAVIGANGGTQSFGFNMTYSGLNAKPTNFTLNGIPCSLF